MILYTLKLVTMTTLLIFISHLFIRYLLIDVNRNNIKLNKNNESTEIVSDDHIIKEKLDDNNLTNTESDIENDSDDSIDLSKMKNELQNYIVNNKQIYKDNKDSVVPNANCKTEASADFNNDNGALSQYFKNQVNTNDILLYNEPKEKQVYIDETPKINNKSKSALEQSDYSWSYNDENIMNGGEIGDGLFGYDSLDGQYATL